MPYIPDDLIEEIRSRSDIVEVVGSYVKLTKKGSSYFGLCPFHNEKTSSFSVSGSKQIFYCFGCHKGGSVFRFIQDYENMTFVEAAKVLADRAGISLPEVELDPSEKRKADLRNTIIEINTEAARYFHFLLETPAGNQAKAYFAKRQLTPQTITAWGLGVTPLKSDGLYQYLKKKGYSDQVLKETELFTYSEKGVRDKFFHRVMFPILNANKKVIAFGGRVMGEGEPKYLNSKETKVFDKSSNLFGLYLARSTRKDHFIICEGYMDVISMHQAGFNQAVASLGTALTTNQVNLMKRYVKKVLICYDSDGAGTKAALRAMELLRDAGLNTKVINLTPYKDPDEFIKAEGAQAFEKRIEEAENSFMFSIRILERDYDRQDPTGRTEFFKEVARRVLTFEDELERTNYSQAIADHYQISYKAFQDMVTKMAAQGIKVPAPLKKNAYTGPKEKEDGILKTQRMLLTWVVENQMLYHKIKPYLSSEDFSNEEYQQVAKEIFQGIESGAFNPAELADRFMDGEGANLVAKILNTRVIDEEADSRDLERAINEAVIAIRRNSLEAKSRNALDVTVLQNIIKEQAELDKIHISIN